MYYPYYPPPALAETGEVDGGKDSSVAFAFGWPTPAIGCKASHP